MPLRALLLLIASAFLHTGWNYLVKRVVAKQIFTWWTLTMGCLFYIPLIWLHWPIPPKIWFYAIASALGEAIFFISLVRAYEFGDFSLVYPVARGAAPAMLSIWTLIFLGEQPTPGGVAGLLTLIVGLTLVGGASLIMRRGSTRVSLHGLFSALLIAFWISVYSVIDGAAVRLWVPQGYCGLILSLTALFLTPVIFSKHSPHDIFAVLRTNFFRIVAVAILMLVTYVFVLAAYQIAKVSYVAAIREMSVILAALAGWRLMGEEFGLIRTAGSILIFLGILCIAIAG
jgi:drug/metabolite transporter (DMT)-like permease